MGVDVIDVGRRGSGIAQRRAHRLDRPVAVGRRIGDAVRRQRIAVSCKLGVNVRAAASRGFPFLENQKSRAFTQDKPIARRIERPACRLRRIVVRRHCRQQAKAREADRADHRVESARKREIDTAATDQLQRRADRLSSRGAGRMHRRRIAVDAEAAREQRKSACRLAAAENHRIVRGLAPQELVRMHLAVGRGLKLDALEIRVGDAHHPGADRATPSRGCSGRRRDACVANRLLRGGERKKVRAVGELDLPSITVQDRIVETLDLGGDARRKTAGVEEADRRRAAPSRQHRAPCRGDIVADRRHQAEAGDRDATPGLAHEASPSANSTRAVATELAPNLRAQLDACERRVVVCELGADLDVLARRDERSHLDVGHLALRRGRQSAGREPAPRAVRLRESARPAGGSREKRDCAESDRRKTPPARGTLKRARRDLPGTCSSTGSPPAPRRESARAALPRCAAAPGAAEGPPARRSRRPAASGRGNARAR